MTGAWKPSLACTPQKIRKEIIACENAAAAAVRKGDRQVAKEQQRLEAVLKKRQEVLDYHHQALAKMTQEHDSSLRAMVRKTDADLEESAQCQQRADEERRAMQLRVEELDRQKSILEKEVKRLYGLLNKLQKDFEQKREMMMELTENSVLQSFSCAAEEVRNTSLYAQEVQADAFMTIDRMQEEMKMTSEVAYAMAESRSRFEALHKVAAIRSIKGISEQHFEREKQQIMQKWLSDWDGHITSLSPGPPSLAQITRPETPMVPSEARPRSVELARRKAEAQALSRGKLASLSEDRPRTAP